jgi:hypothetical protein
MKVGTPFFWFRPCSGSRPGVRFGRASVSDRGYAEGPPGSAACQDRGERSRSDVVAPQVADLHPHRLVRATVRRPASPDVRARPGPEAPADDDCREVVRRSSISSRGPRTTSTPSSSRASRFAVSGGISPVRIPPPGNTKYVWPFRTRRISATRVSSRRTTAARPRHSELLTQRLERSPPRVGRRFFVRVRLVVQVLPAAGTQARAIRTTQDLVGQGERDGVA